MTTTLKLKRTPHWATREFHEFFVSRAKMPFAWGANDCALFAADGIQVMTGVDIAADFRGKYSTEAGAFALIKTLTGGTTVADAAAHCAQQHGLAELAHPLKAQRGDLVTVSDDGNLIAGIVHLTGSKVAVMGARGIKLVPITSLSRAWHF